MKIDKYELDNDQINIVKDDNRFILVVAGAGSGKTLTILGKINYLVNTLNYKPNEILCISFTKASSTELYNKIYSTFNIKIDVFTFHKLAINILNSYKKEVEICDSHLLEDIINKYLFTDILSYKKQMKIVLKLLGRRFTLRVNYLKYLNNNKNKVKILEKNIATFIRLFKCNGFNINKFKELFNRKNRLFLLITFNIYLLYSNYLDDTSEYDFDDLIIKATNILDKQYKDYKYIIIDEYQDTSYIRFNLIKKIVDLNNSKLMAVGDDFQSIYRFTGCNIDLFTNFNKYYEGSKTMYISNTYRNSQELISIAGSFVMKNKYQLKKDLKSSKKLNNPVKIIYYKNIIKEVENIIIKLDSEILILGRNNNDINMIIDNKTFIYKNSKIIYLKNKDINITFLTVHKSKGLEYDNVIIINLVDNVLGFPSQLKDDITLKCIIKEEKYPYSEERRLFYVALTRTKNYVYLLSPYKNKSCFIKELEKNKSILKIMK